jgi:signal transduction histidine kinase
VLRSPNRAPAGPSPEPPEAIASVDVSVYAEALGEFLRTRSEAALYRASLMSRSLAAGGVAPDEIVALHVEALELAVEGMGQRGHLLAATDGLQFLLEVMIAYGVQHKEHLERRLRELADSNASRAEILATVAHELRTPLTAVKGNLDLAVRRLAGGEVEAVPPLLGQSRSAVDRLVRMTADMVEASRDRPSEVRRERVELAPLLAQACAWTASGAAEKGIGLALEPAEPGAGVLGDADGLLGVFGNLISNAVRYTPAGGRVMVRHRVDGERVEVEVRDTGVGMTAEVQARIFEKFYRAPEAQLAVPQGLGLGLSLVKQTVEAHGGEVAVESAPGQGSTFRLHLPCAPGA